MKRKNQGFTLLIAIVVTSMLLVVSFMVVNIAFKQLLISDASEESQYSFYNADSGVECATFWDIKNINTTNPFNPSTPSNISCGGSSIAPTRTAYVSGVSTSTFTITLTKGCADVEVVKNQTLGTTKVNSRGYNTCTAGALRRYERGVTSTFPSNPAIAVSVTWTNASGVSVSGDSLTKTAADGWGNSGAASVQSITSGNGYVEFSTNESNTWKMGGLSNGDTNQDYTDIDFALQPDGSGVVQIFESGTVKSLNAGTYVAGDVFRVAVESGVVKYYKNGTLIYTSSVTPTYPLIFDAALQLNGATIVNAKVAS